MARENGTRIGEEVLPCADYVAHAPTLLRRPRRWSTSSRAGFLNGWRKGRMKKAIIALAIVQCLGSAEAAPVTVDPVTARMIQFCRGREQCVTQQREGIRALLREITIAPRPSQARVQWCLERATNKRQLTNWPKAARCIR